MFLPPWKLVPSVQVPSVQVKFCHFTINLHLMIKVKVINMARKPKRNQEAYTRLGFLPKQKKLNITNIEQDVQLGVTQELDKRGSKRGKEEVNSC